MKRAALYSSTSRARGREADSRPGAGGDGAQPAGSATAPGDGRVRAFLRRHDRPVLFAAGALAALLVGLAATGWRTTPVDLQQADIDAAVLHTLENKNLPSRTAKAAESVRQSVVRVRGLAEDIKDPTGGERPYGVGSGFVIVDTGIILTNLHVVDRADRIMVTFFDGMESEATIIGVQPENDLAVLRAKSIPDDLPAATLGSTQDLQPGDEVVAVGFPFGIGPSVSAGVVSGMNREFHSRHGKRVLTRLIQFDAAANPGNSGGPLVTMGGEVVGIVTAILNPTEAGTFIGIAFAATIESAGSAVGIPPF